MKKLTEHISEALASAFTDAGYDGSLARVTLSNRPDLCEFQCNGAMAGAKLYKKAPIVIAGDVAARLADSPVFASVEAAPPGFINMKVSPDFLAGYAREMAGSETFGLERAAHPKTIVIDYGGPNVAKPLHIGHLRSAIIGESIKRIYRYVGHHVIGDVHLGDWGLQMGLIITELKKRKPELVYFDPDYQGEYPEEPPFTMSELEAIYPAASAYSKEHPEYKEEALLATRMFQEGEPGYLALGQHILNLSVADIRKIYDRLDVSFDIWKKESDAKPFIPYVVDTLKEKGLAYEDQGALIVDVQEETDKKELPPCIILKSDGSSLYATTDLGTLVDREKNYHPDKVLYLADKRQLLHFTQVFRVAKKAGFVPEDTELQFMYFGTMNGKDGKPFKTREGGVMRLEQLMDDIVEEMLGKINENHTLSDEEARKTAAMVGLSALKYGDLSNQASKDYNFDLERFTSFEGNTGPYILYTIVRIKSILKKYEAQEGALPKAAFLPPAGDCEKSLLLNLTGFAGMMESACEDSAPHKVCSYIYELSNDFNRFYHETKIMAESDKARQASWISLLVLTKDVLEACIHVLGFEAPERM